MHTMPSRDHTGTPSGLEGFFHFTSSTIAGLALRTMARRRDRVSLRQSFVALMMASISCEATVTSTKYRAPGGVRGHGASRRRFDGTQIVSGNLYVKVLMGLVSTSRQRGASPGVSESHHGMTDRPGPDPCASMTRVHVVELVFAIGWAAFWLYWLVAAFSMKREHVAWSHELRIRVVIAVLVVLLLRVGVFHGHDLDSGPWRAGFGLILFALGLWFAIWARLHIRENWGTPMSRKDEPELVTSGPYRLVRHPIYSGILVAGAGTAVALSWTWIVAVALAAVYFVYSATVEERYLTERFPDAYPAYRRSTKMLVPWIF